MSIDAEASEDGRKQNSLNSMIADLSKGARIVSSHTRVQRGSRLRHRPRGVLKDITETLVLEEPRRRKTNLPDPRHQESSTLDFDNGIGCPG